MGMNLNKVRSDFKDSVLPASFSAKGPGFHSDGPRVLVYAYKTGRIGGPFLWVFWDGCVMDEGREAIKDGGRAETFREAVDLAIERLMQRVDDYARS